jgi:hypothetical protein
MVDLLSIWPPAAIVWAMCERDEWVCILVKNIFITQRDRSRQKRFFAKPRKLHGGFQARMMTQFTVCMWLATGGITTFGDWVS